MAKAKKKKADKKEAVKIEEDFDNPAAIAKLTPAQYWEWRTSVEEKSHEDTRVRVAQLRQQIAELQVSEAKLRAQLAANDVKEALMHQKRITDDYHAFRMKLETELGVGLRGCTINPYSYEVSLHDTEEA